jgi:hypothetical protein
MKRFRLGRVPLSPPHREVVQYRAMTAGANPNGSR